ncbi:MAG: polysaccharide deacetylase family protein [Oscillospiraceae bacterium]|nr:polysaccharide deacetylase family protein [Oscillospiraceae bacterium]
MKQKNILWRAAVVFAAMTLALSVFYACGQKTADDLTTTIPDYATEPDSTTLYGDWFSSTSELTLPAPDESTTELATFPEEATAPVAEQSVTAKPSMDITLGKANPASGLPSGLDPLPERPVTIADPNNAKGLPTKKIEHSFGYAKDEVPHDISVTNQKFFDDKGYAAITLDQKTPGKVLYLTFDSGYENGNTEKILNTLKEKGVPAAFFCTTAEMKAVPDLIGRMIKEGHIVGNHSVKHPSFAEIDRTRMAQEVIEADNYLRTNFGYSAPFFRFPMGEYSESALDALASLGYYSVFWSLAYSDWDTANQKGAQNAIDTVMERIHPGAVILLHSVSTDNTEALADIIDAARAKGYEFRSLTQFPV